MRLYWIAFKIWAGTVFLSAVIMIITFLFEADRSSLVMPIFLALMGMFFSFPFLVPIAEILRLSHRIPYSTGAKIGWLAFLFGLMQFFCIHIFHWFTDKFFSAREFKFLQWSSISALLIVLFLLRNTLQKFYSQQTTSNKQS